MNPFKIDIPGTPSRIAIRPAFVGFSDNKFSAWLDTLSLEHLRALQGRIEAYQRSGHQKFEAEGSSPQLDDAMKRLANEERLVTEAIGRWLDRNEEA